MSSSRNRVPVTLATPQGPFELRLFDHRHELVTTGYGEIERRLYPGLYRVEIDAGSKVDERYLTVGESGLVERDLRIDMPSAAPVEGTSTTHEFHAGPAMRYSRELQHRVGQGARLVVFVRSMGNDPQAPVDVSGLSLVDARQRVLLDSQAFEVDAKWGWAALSVDVAPGGYALRQRRPSTGEGEELVDQSLWAEEGWTTIAFVPSRPEAGGPQPEFASLHLYRLSEGFLAYNVEMQRANLALEVALSGLRQGKALVPPQLERLLLEAKFTNPMLGVVGALALLQGHETNWRLFHEVRKNLGRLVPQLPDVDALHVMAKLKRDDDSNSRIYAAGWPPLLQACYRGLIERDAEETLRIIPAGSVADLAAPRLLTASPWSRWRALEESSEAASAANLQRQIAELMQQFEAEQVELPDWPATIHRVLGPALEKLELAAPQRRERPVGEGIDIAQRGFAPEVLQVGEIEMPRETLRLTRYLGDLSAQRAPELLAGEPEKILDLRQLSSRLGLPRATTVRALQSLVGGRWKE